jgi:protoporphyrinogen oxidase
MKSQTSFDVIIIGAGLSGLSIAWVLKQQGLQVTVLEGSEQALGTHHPIKIGPFQLDNGFSLVTDDDFTKRALEWLKTLGLPLSYTSAAQSLWTYDSGQLKPWKAFRDDQHVEAIEAFSPFMLPQRLSLSHTFYEIGEWLKTQLEGLVQYRQLVTKIVPAEAGAFVYVGNKEKPLQARTVVYTGDLTDLPLLIPEELLGQRLRQHLKRPKAWTMLSLDLLHEQLIEEDPNKLFILDSSTADELAPLWGYFMPPPSTTESATSTIQVSRWVSFLPDADAEDADQSSQLIKKMKKQIRRAFPKVDENVPVSERITLLPGHSGTFVDSSIKEGQFLKGFPALKLASSRLSPWAGGLWRWAERAMTISQSVLEEGLKRSAHEQSPLTMETGLPQL